MSDPILDRVSYDPGPQTLSPIPFPSGLAPTPVASTHGADDSLPSGDVLVVTWTAAEFRALADVLTPGHPSTGWSHYRKDWSAYEGQLTDRSPAREARRLGEYAVTTIGTKTVVCFHSQLHLATDGLAPPIVALWQQIVAEVSPQLVVTTGTAGGIGAATALGDVFVVSNAKFNCTESFKDKAWAQQRFTGAAGPGTVSDNITLAQDTLIPVNSGRFISQAPRSPEISLGGDVETVDYFAFANDADTYHVASNDPDAHTEEMDDATLPLALSLMTGATPPWLSIRNASDPQVPSSEGNLEQQKQWAEEIYQRYGYWTTVGSALACWAVVADLS